MALCLVAGQALVSAAAANTFHPNRLGDHIPDGNCNHADCTLREAVIRANNSPGTADTIVLQAGKTYRLSIPGLSEQMAQQGDLDINSPITIKSSGQKLATIKQTAPDRVFESGVLVPANVRLVRLGMTGGNGGLDNGHANGGAILNAAGNLNVLRSLASGNTAAGSDLGEGGGGVASKGTGTTRIIRSSIRGNHAQDGGGVEAGDDLLVVKRSRIAGNNATGAGGGVDTARDVRIDRSTIAGNQSGSYGGGLRMDGMNLGANVTNSTISGNQAGNRGGGINIGGTLDLINDTIAGNSTTREGGGIVAISGTTNLRSVTVARNRADSANVSASIDGGGVAIGEPALAAIDVRNSLIVLNRGHDAAIDDCGSETYTSFGHNITTTGSTCSGFSQPGDIQTAAPKIGQLGSFGGPTRTVPLFSGSTAIGHSGSNAPPRDQRGVKRDAHPDTGAFERR